LENITITKSLDLLAYVNDSFFIMQGSVTVTPGASSTINIIGMINLNGSVNANTVPPGNRTTVRILGCQLQSGNIGFGYNNYDLTVEGCSIAGAITYNHGNIVGNTINSSTSYAIQAGPESIATADTSYIFGNKISNSYYLGYGISWTSTTMAFDIRNNFVTCPYYGIYVSSTTTTTQLNKVYNNTVSISNAGSNYLYGIYVSGSSGSQIDVQNNVVDRNSSTNYTYYGIYGSAGSGGNLTVTYNWVDNGFTTPISGSITVNLNNNTTTAISLNGTGSTVGGVGQNGGNPGVQFYDTDLTVNDAGCYGGSFTLNNFFPSFTGSAITWLTNYQFNLRTGNTLSIKANSFDR
jgi:hypothetical protein